MEGEEEEKGKGKGKGGGVRKGREVKGGKGTVDIWALSYN